MQQMLSLPEDFPQIDLDHWTKVRRHFHQHPELSGYETHTAAEAALILKDMSLYEVHEGIGGTGVLAIYKAQKEGPTLLFRTELDALPIQEINEFDHRSNTDGVSHKCGHDGHLTIVLALAERIRQSPPERGTVVLLLQPAEENGQGAAAILADERFHELVKPDAVYALHNLPGYPLGHACIRHGSFTAAVNSSVYRLYGKTAHAAEPEHGHNPGKALAKMMQFALSQSRNVPDAEDFSVVTPICMRLGDESYGISAGYGELHLTVRCWREEQLQELCRVLEKEMKRIAESENLRLEAEYIFHFHANENADEPVNEVLAAADRIKLPRLERDYPFKWGEDFGLFTQRYPGAMFGIGSGEDCPALHNPDYDFPDALIDTASAVFYQIVKQKLK